MSFIAAGASANCWELPIDGARVQTGEVAVDRRHVVMGFPEIGRAFVVAADLSEVFELRPNNGDAFADGPGFGTSVALHGDIAAIGAVRIGGHGPGVEQPAGIFHTGAVYAFNISSGALLWHAASNDRFFGHSLSVEEQGVAYGVYESPDPDGKSVRLRDAAQGSIAFRSREGEFLRAIDGPADAHGFGASLSGRNPVITTAASADALGIWALRGDVATQIASMPLTLNGIPATHLAAEGSTVAISAAGGFSSDAGRTRILAPGSSTYEIAAGGPLAMSADRLSVLVHAAPEGQPHNRLFVYDTSNGEPAEVIRIDHVIGAALDGRTAFVILAEPGAPIRLCKVNTSK